MPGKEERGFRLLWMYETLDRGLALKKTELAERFGVSEKTAQRDIENLRNYLAEEHASDIIQYDKTTNEYRIVRSGQNRMTDEERLALCKILLESRAFQREELDPLIGKILRHAASEELSFIKKMIRNELFYYVPLRHGKRLLSSIWKLSQLVHEQEVTRFRYTRQDGVSGDRKVKPAAVMFSEFYFYLIAWLADDSKEFPAVFRVDRAEDIRGTGEKFSIPYSERFSTGEFRKRVQFMYPGDLRRVTFKFKGDSIEAVLDRLPTAEILETSGDGTYTVTAEVYGKGADMWLRSQGDFVRDVRSRAVNGRNG
jgi:predicted DNA-binding transcriptional regulator YafY